MGHCLDEPSGEELDFFNRADILKASLNHVPVAKKPHHVKYVLCRVVEHGRLSLTKVWKLFLIRGDSLIGGGRT